jgi:asparagine synthase (glutamine-hydrolysing)
VRPAGGIAGTGPAYAEAVRAQMTELLHQPDAPLFDLIDHGALAAAFTADPMLPGMIGLLSSPYACAAFLLDVNEWLAEYKVSLV